MKRFKINKKTPKRYYYTRRRREIDARSRAYGLALVALCVLSIVVPPLAKIAHAATLPSTIVINPDPLPSIVVQPTPDPSSVAQAKPQPVPQAHAPAPRQPVAPARPSGSGPSQAQKDITASVCGKVGASRADFLQAQGVPLEVFKTSCYYDLLAIAYAESRFNCDAVGDQGRSRGCFQIQTKLHGLTTTQAEDFAYAAEWTLDRMVRDINYPTYRTAAITRHNGAGPMADAYAHSVKSTAEAFNASGL